MAKLWRGSDRRLQDFVHPQSHLLASFASVFFVCATVFRGVNWKSIAPARAGIDRPRLQEAGLAPTLSEVAEGDLVEAERLLASLSGCNSAGAPGAQNDYEGALASSGEVTPALHLGASDWGRPRGAAISSLHS